MTMDTTRTTPLASSLASVVMAKKKSMKGSVAVDPMVADSAAVVKAVAVVVSMVVVTDNLTV